MRDHGDGGRARGIVVTGTGRAFSAGEDINEAVGQSLLAEVELFHDLTRSVLETQVPVVAAVNGLAVGGAAEWTLCFDARLGTPQTEYFCRRTTSACRLQRRQLPAAAAGGRPGTAAGAGLDRLGADEAQSLGLLDEIADPGTLVATAIALSTAWTEPGTATAVHLEAATPVTG